MYAPCLAATLILLVILAAVYVCGSPETFLHRRPRPASQPARQPARQPASRPKFCEQSRSWMWWWRHPGYAAPLELSLPLRNFHEYVGVGVHNA